MQSVLRIICPMLIMLQPIKSLFFLDIHLYNSNFLYCTDALRSCCITGHYEVEMKDTKTSLGLWNEQPQLPITHFMNNATGRFLGICEILLK